MLRDSSVYLPFQTRFEQTVIREYAKRRGQEIVKEDSDEGESGLKYPEARLAQAGSHYFLANAGNIMLKAF